MAENVEHKAEVIIIGGGATGVGISRDLALRGIPSILIDKGDLASGASGRNHGLLHSGGRYAVSDPKAARECIIENQILKRIAPHCIEASGGLFISLPEDGLEFQQQFLKACDEAGIETTVLHPKDVLELEPNLNPNLIGAVHVPDGAVDPFTLVLENARNAENLGAKFFLHTEVTSLLTERGKLRRVLAKNLLTGQDYTFRAPFLVNATGAWVNNILTLVGLHIGMSLHKGSMLITNQRTGQRVINRCRKPSDGDIIVPNQTGSILGTTSVPLQNVDDFEVTPSEISLLMEEGSKLIPRMKETRFIRAYAGIRPLLQSETQGNGRTISRGFALIDHGKSDGIQNLITITGGKFITYRLMAEKTADLICQKMGVDISCSTHLTPLPGASEQRGVLERLKKFTGNRGETICDCELVPRKEIERSLKREPVKDFRDILHRTRLAKGTCQGGFCVYRLLGVLHELGLAKGDTNEVLKNFLEERWKGILPVLWGDSLREQELIESIYKGMFNLR